MVILFAKSDSRDMDIAQRRGRDPDLLLSNPSCLNLPFDPTEHMDESSSTGIEDVAQLTTPSNQDCVTNQVTNSTLTQNSSETLSEILNKMTFQQVKRYNEKKDQ